MPKRSSQTGSGVAPKPNRDKMPSAAEMAEALASASKEELLAVMAAQEAEERAWAKRHGIPLDD